jgi:serine/threonine protein kinase
VALRELLDGVLPDPQQATLTGHLDTCADCQETLEALAVGGESLVAEARCLAQPATPPDPALSRAINELRGQARGSSLGAAPALDFLDPPENPGDLGRLGPYEIREVIGWGSMGIVLKAFDTTVHREVALKVLAPHLASYPTARQRFLREARAAAVGHRHVVLIYDVKEAKGLPYIVMEYVAGLSLQQRLNRGGPPSVEEIVRIGRQTAAGLAAAHARGVIHRDIKPANILLEAGTGRVRITDFGLARAVDDASLTQRGVLAGTPQYMAPEQARGEELDHRADLFSLGSVLYILCTGRSPFRAANTLAVLKRVCEDEPTPVRDINPGIPDWLEDVIARLHAKAPEDRFQSAAEVAELFASYLEDGQQPALSSRGSRRTSFWKQGRTWMAIGMLLLLPLGGWGVAAWISSLTRANNPREPGKEEEQEEPDRFGPAAGERIPAPHLRPLLAQLKAKEPYLRKDAAEKLADLRATKADRERVTRALTPLLDDPDHFTRQSMIRALGVWGTSKSVPALVKLLNHPDVFTRGAALVALGKFPDERAAKAVVEYLPKDGAGASRALIMMGPIAEKPVIQFLLRSTEWQVQCEACRVLAVIGSKRSIPALEKAALASGHVAREAKEALAAIDRRQP